MLDVDTGDPTPLSAQIERAIRASIASGQLMPGDRLPTVRQLAVDLCVNANIIARVYAELERTGVLETRRGAGTFVIGHRPEPMSRRQRQRELRALEDRFLAEAAALGFSLDEILEQLEQRQRW